MPSANMDFLLLLLLLFLKLAQKEEYLLETTFLSKAFCVKRILADSVEEYKRENLERLGHRAPILDERGPRLFPKMGCHVE